MRRIAPAIRAKMPELYAAGNSMRDVAKELHVAPATVKKELEERNVISRGYGSRDEGGCGSVDDYSAALVRFAASQLQVAGDTERAKDAAAYALWIRGSNFGGLDAVKRCLRLRQEDKRYDTIVGNIVFAVQSGGFKPNAWRDAA